MQTQDTITKLKSLYGYESHGTNFLTFEETEVWKTLEEDENYQVSNFGRIKSLSRWYWSGRTYQTLKWSPERILDHKPNKHGYKRFFITNSELKKQKSVSVHQMVAKYFLGEKPLNTEIDHIDGDKTNNYHLNLRYVTHSENIKHYYELKKQLKNKLAA